MTDYYVDSNSGSNGDTGLTQALAWATIEYAIESGGLSAGDDIWVRRTHLEYSGLPTSDIRWQAGGARNNPKRLIGWPRAAIPNTTITSASWTSGSTTVDLVIGVTLDREKHCGRWATAPNGSKFLITQITDSNTLIIDREYSGPTVTLTNGLFQIEADEDYSDRPSDVDGWDSDADDLPLIDFQDQNYSLRLEGYFLVAKNLEVKDSINTAYSSLYVSHGSIVGCLLYQSNAGCYCLIADTSYIDRCIISGSTGYGIDSETCVIKNIAIYGVSQAKFDVGGYLENVNLGVEGAVGVSILFTGKVTGRDVKIRAVANVSENSEQGLYDLNVFSIENFQKILGDHKIFTNVQELTSKDVVAGSGDPYKRSGGADKIIEIDCSDYDSAGDAIPERAVIVFTHEFETDISSKSYRYYVNCKALSLTATELWLEVEYVDSYDDTSEYTITKEVSDEACSLRSGVSDWTQYIEVTGITPAVASKVRIKCFVAKYDADGYIYIDPQVVVS